MFGEPRYPRAAGPDYGRDNGEVATHLPGRRGKSVPNWELPSLVPSQHANAPGCVPKLMLLAPATSRFLCTALDTNRCP